MLGTIVGLDGVRFDFNLGLRLFIPEGNWHVKISDNASKIVLFDQDISDTLLISAEKFFIRWEIELSLNGQKVFHHIFNAEGKKVHFQFFETGMGDHLGLFPWIETFRRFHHCKTSFTCAEYMKEMFAMLYPEVEYLESPPIDSYATYHLCPTFHPFIAPDETARAVPMDKHGRKILGLPEIADIKYIPTESRKIKENYVCIAIQSSTTTRTWLAPNEKSWDIVVNYLKSLGYRVLCIDKEREVINGGNTVKMPDDAEDFTGLPLSECVKLLSYADFFIGVSSGLPWLAHSVGIPGIIVGGVCADWFETPPSPPNIYRVTNPLVCHGCHGEVRIPWSVVNSGSGCYKYGSSERAFECSKKISAQQVIDTIDFIRNKLYKCK